MVRKQEPTPPQKKKFGRQTISAHYIAPEGSFRDEGRVLNFVLVSLNSRRERKRHVVGTNVIPHVGKVYNLKINKKLQQLHVRKYFSHGSVEDDQNR